MNMEEAYAGEKAKPEIQQGSRVRFLQDHYSIKAGDTGIVTMRAGAWAAVQVAGGKHEGGIYIDTTLELITEEATVAQDIEWKTVTYEEWLKHDRYGDTAERITYPSGSNKPVYEIEAPKVKAPTGNYALVVPGPDVVRDEYYFYIGIDEQWYAIDPEDPEDDIESVSTDTVQEALDDGTHIIQFPGV